MNLNYKESIWILIAAAYWSIIFSPINNAMRFHYGINGRINIFGLYISTLIVVFFLKLIFWTPLKGEKRKIVYIFIDILIIEILFLLSAFSPK